MFIPSDGIMTNKPMLVLSFGMVAVMEMQTALSLNRNVDRLVCFFLEVGISLYIKNEKVEAIDCLAFFIKYPAWYLKSNQLIYRMLTL